MAKINVPPEGKTYPENVIDQKILKSLLQQNTNLFHIVSGILKVPPGFRSQTHERENDLHQTAEEETSSLGLSGLPQTQNTPRRRSSHIFFIYMFFKQSLSILNADY